MSALKLEDFNYLDESAKQMVAKLIRENDQAVQMMNMPKARSIYQHILSICRNAGGENRPAKGVDSSRVPMGGGFVPSSLSASGLTITHAGYGYHSAPRVVMPGPELSPEILESIEPKIVDQLNTKDWWELGKEIIKD